MIEQEVKGFGDALALLHIGPLVVRALLTHNANDMQHYLKGERETGSVNRVRKLLEIFPWSSSSTTCDGFSSRLGIFQSQFDGPSRLLDVLGFRAKDTDGRNPDSSCLSCIRLS